jgi:hypothetical protein
MVVKAEKWLAQTTAEKVATVRLIDQSIKCHNKASNTLAELKRLLVQTWMREDTELEIKFHERNFMQLMRSYHKAIEEGKDQFDFEGQPVLVGYAKYLIEYLEPRMTDMYGATLKMRISMIRKEHTKKMEARDAVVSNS